jgi:predicted hydrocarbon binding protein
VETREYRKVVSAFVYFPKKNYFLVSLEMNNRSGDLAAVSQVLAESKVSILNGSYNRGTQGQPGSWQMFIVPLDQNLSANDMRKILTSCPDVAKCQIQESKDGLLVDSLTFPIKLSSGQRAMIIRNEIWSNILQKTRQKFSTGGNVIIYDQGISAGKIVARELLNEIGRENVAQQFDQIISMYQAVGWGKADVLSYEQKPLRVAVRMKDSAECMNQQSDRPIGHFIRGHLAGLAGELFGIVVKCTETSCIAKGQQYCEFLVEEDRKAALP